MTDPTAQPYGALGRVDAGPYPPPPTLAGGAIPAWDDTTVATGPLPASWRPLPPVGFITTDLDQLEQARELRRHRRRRSSPVPFVLIGLTALMAGLAVIAVVMYSRGEAPLGLPIGRDSGVAACRLLAAPTPSPSVRGTRKAGFEQQADDAAALAKMREMFADSRYADLRESGVKMIDITAQVVADPDSALLYVGQFSVTYASLAGACGAHGAPLPPLKSS